MPVEFCVTFC